MDLLRKVLLPDELLQIWLLLYFLLGKIWFIRGLAHHLETESILSPVSGGRMLFFKVIFLVPRIRQAHFLAL